MGADDLTLKSGFDEIWYPSDVVYVGVGEKQVVYFFGGTGN